MTTNAPLDELFRKIQQNKRMRFAMRNQERAYIERLLTNAALAAQNPLDRTLSSALGSPVSPTGAGGTSYRPNIDRAAIQAELDRISPALPYPSSPIIGGKPKKVNRTTRPKG